MSFDLAELMMDIEDEFGFRIPDKMPRDFDGLVGSLITVCYAAYTDQLQERLQALEAVLAECGDAIIDRPLAKRIARHSSLVTVPLVGLPQSPVRRLAALIDREERGAVDRATFALKVRELIGFYGSSAELPREEQHLIRDLGLD